MKKLMAGAASVLMMGGALTVISAGAAAAATNAPSCVDRYVYNDDGMPQGQHVRLTNNCRSTKKVKVIWTRAHDSKCFTLSVGERVRTGSDIAVPFSHYDKTVLC